MPEPQTLLLFSAAVLAMLVAPGPNMAYVLAHGLADGPRAGVAAALGIFVADLVLLAVTALGLSALIMSWPASFDVLRIAGALYLLWLAWQALRASAAPGRDGVRVQPTLAQVLRRACANGLLNPKALLFFLVFLPQFVDPALGHVSAQLAVLGAVLSVEALAFHALLGVASGSIGRRVSSARAQRVFGRVLGLVFLGLALRLLLMDRPDTLWSQ
jgi:threonine/homoserine/homoserine lactone efflux protein